ncbi:flagellar hook-associated protein 3 FlgL [Desulfonauticus submarinus]|uniref:Flagellar hook-associated protein 3 FlgL n=1 Tax=Desulfonauticus submarinus TaxID=206665 RepID=A0A1H0AJD7_9BACT|nr:flagellar hook-associated protein FlgL [Desulfonauticus submarinus]SDN33692.1 flagellar hook-associated protein 3 FlgL [Desulfonauticus submarinus]
MRVSQRDLFTTFINQFHYSTSKLVELNKKAASQKQVNKPSDNPIGMTRILDYRDSIAALAQYKKNIDTAKGWLNLSDETLMQVNNILIRLKEISEQGATGTLTKEQRQGLAYEARQLFSQLVNLSNTEYEGKSIFAGHKVNEDAFVEGLWLTSNKNDNVDGFINSISGNSSKTVLVQFLTDGVIGTNAINYRYSEDGGDTWQTGTIAAGSTTLNLGDIQVDFTAGYTVQANSLTDYNDDSGTWLWVRPTAIYQGDVEEDKVVDLYAQNTALTAQAYGNFDKNLNIRIDDITGTTITYSYSTDGGNNWTTGNTTDNTTFLVPGGRVEVNSQANLTVGDQLIVRPEMAKIEVEISASEKVQINHVGKDIFGGIYQNEVVFSGAGKNVFETVGKLVGFLETNNQSGIQEALENLNDSLNHISNQLASIGARENRLEVAGNILSGLSINEKERLSKIEDADVAELMTQLANQQIIYEAVLKSSSMIMRMSLVNYI